MVDLVVSGAQALVVAADRPPLADGWLAVADGRVVATGTGTPPAASRSLDARGQLVLPGMVSAHHHLFQGASRGVATGHGLHDWLVAHYARWAGLTPEQVGAAAALSIAQLLVRGCTTVAGFEFLHPGGRDVTTPVLAAAERLGIRLLYVRGCTPRLEPGAADALAARDVDVDLLLEPEDVALRRTRELVTTPPTPRLRWGCGPTTPVGDDGGEFQRALNAIADAAGVPVHCHFHPLTPVPDGDAHALAVRLGLVRRGNWLAHGSRLGVDDVGRLGADGVGVVHCPSASLLLGYRLPDLVGWRDASDRIAVGVDGAASNDRGSLLGEAQLAFYTQRAAGLSPETALELVTSAAARTIGWDGVGALTPGSEADLATFDLWDLDGAGGPVQPQHALLRLLRTYQGARARHVLVGGEPVVGDGQLLTGDERVIAAAANEAAEALASEAHTPEGDRRPTGTGG